MLLFKQEFFCWEDKMIVKVRMLAFGNGEIREVEIPDDTTPENILNQVFHFGQNDFQPKNCPSVSVGDVIEYDGLQMVVSVGFMKITEQQYHDLLSTYRLDRILVIWAMQGKEEANT
jgi:hypothetical protein